MNSYRLPFSSRPSACYLLCLPFFIFNDTATTEIYTLSLHDALPISVGGSHRGVPARDRHRPDLRRGLEQSRRSEEHTSELQSLRHLVCRLLLEKKKKKVTSKIDNKIKCTTILHQQFARYEANYTSIS